MRIAVVNKLMIPSGSIRWSVGWSQGLGQLGNQVQTVFIREADSAAQMHTLLAGLNVVSYLTGRYARVSEWLGAPFIELWARNSFGLDSSPDLLSWALAPLLGRWRRNFDLVLVYEEFTGLGALVANLLNRTPYILFLQEAIASDEPRTLRSALRPWRRQVARRALMRVANSAKIAASYEKELGLHVDVIPHGCDPAPSIVVPKSDFVLADTRWTPGRDPFFFLEIAERVSRLRFVIAGSFHSPDIEQRFRRELKQRGLAGRVRVATGLTEEKLVQLYRTALVYTRWAAHSTSAPPESGASFGIFQALSQGCPIVADASLSMDPIVRARFRDWVVPTDPACFAEKLETLAADPVRVAALSREAWETAKELSWRNRALKLVQMVSPLMETR
jgi:glycosyltransferase involved in cell wall biosynthesis